MKSLSFSEPMLKAWLSGNKSVTRRLMNPQPDYISPIDHKPRRENAQGFIEIKPPYRPGETVYIKETWMTATPDDGESFGILYRATLSKPWTDVQWKQSFKLDNRAEKYFNGKDVWHSPRFMPEWASRSKARIVSVRPERVQEITREDALREGKLPDVMNCPTMWFQSLWESLHPGSWEHNDWVWRIELKKVIV